jgi:putative transposase
MSKLMKTLNPALTKVLKRLHYSLDVILTCVHWLVSYAPSLRNLEEMMAERGLAVDHSTVHRWAVSRCRCWRKRFAAADAPSARIGLSTRPILR